jgi:hypothetical protein
MKQKFSWKVFISFGLFYSFFIIFLTGIILYLAPAGRVAHWVNWKLFGLNKEQWQAIHTIFAYLFAILSIFHLFSINWKAFWTYIKSKTMQGIHKKKEFYLSSIATILVLLGILFHLPPLSSVMDFGEYLTNSWEDESKEPPIPHAERLSLYELATQLDSISVEVVINTLRANNIQFNNTTQTLEEISTLNAIPPFQIYSMITKQPDAGMTGSGIGKKTLEEFAFENNKEINQILTILKNNGIEANRNQTLKEIASENNIAARDIYQLIK